MFPLLLDVVEKELLPLVLEEKLVATWVELEVVDLAIVIDSGEDLVVSEVLDADGQRVKEVGNDLGGLTSSQLLLGVVEPG